MGSSPRYLRRSPGSYPHIHRCVFCGESMVNQGMLHDGSTPAIDVDRVVGLPLCSGCYRNPAVSTEDYEYRLTLSYYYKLRTGVPIMESNEVCPDHDDMVLVTKAAIEDALHAVCPALLSQADFDDVVEASDATIKRSELLEGMRAPLWAVVTVEAYVCTAWCKFTDRSIEQVFAKVKDDADLKHALASSYRMQAGAFDIMTMILNWTPTNASEPG